MSGPTLLDLTGDIFGGPEVNSIVLNGTNGTMALFVQPPADSVVFELYIGGKLNLKEKVCGIRRTPFPKVKRVEKLVPVSDKVKP